MKIKTKSCSIVLASTFLILFLILISSTASAATDQSASPTGSESITYNVVGAHYKCDSWSNEQYPLVNLFEEDYTPLLANGDPIWRSHVNKLAKLVLDSNKKYTLKTGEKLDLGQDYTLEVKQIDIDGKKVWLEFDKNGQYVDDAIISIDSGNQTWICKLDKIQGEDNINVLKVHVNQVFQGADDSIAQIDGVWLIDYVNAKTLEVGDKIGEIKLTQIINGVDESNLGSLVFERPVYAYITNSWDHTVSVINTATNNVTATVNVGRYPFGVAVNPTGTRVYVPNEGSNDVSIIDTATNTVTATVNVGFGPHGAAVNPEGTKVYVTNYGDNNVSVIDTATNTVTATANVGGNPQGVAVTPDGAKLYVVNYWDSTVSVIDTATNTVTATVSVGYDPNGVVVNPEGTKVYVTTSGDSAVSVIDTATNTVTATVNVGKWPLGIVVNPDGTKAYVANAGDNTTSVIDTVNNNVIATVHVGGSPFGIAVSPDGTKVYVVIINSNTVSVINSATNNVIATVNVGGNPIGFGQFMVPPLALKPVLPVANFSSDVTTGNAPLDVQFTDLSENVTEWNWSFGDGSTSTEQNPTHTYSTAGNYTVKLIVSNTKGTDSKLATINVAVAYDSIEIRGPVYNGSNIDDIIAKQGNAGTIKMDGNQFAAFYYDLDNNVTNESLSIKKVAGTASNIIGEHGLVYQTTIQQTNYKYGASWGNYRVLSFFGNKYIPLKANDASKLAKLALDSDDKYTLKTGEKIELGQRYTLEAKQVDVDGQKVWLELDKDGEYVDDSIIAIDSGDQTWTCKLDKIQGEDDVPVLKVHVNQVFQGAVDSIAQIDGIWLIDYANTMKIESSDKFGKLNDVSINGASLLISNKDSVTLTRNSDVIISPGLYFKVADDTNALRFYAFKQITYSGNYEIRGKVATGNSNWNANNFAGFFYDLNNNVATETLKVSGIRGRMIPEGGLEYSTTIKKVSYGYKDAGWGNYSVLGFFGDKYIPLKANDASKLAKLVLDRDDKYTLKTGEKLDLGQGYALEAKQVDVDGMKVWLEFTKDGQYVDDKIVATDSGDHTWTSELDKIQGEDDVPVLKVHVNQVFQGAVDSIAQIDGIWLIDYANTTKIESDDEFGKLNDVSINGATLTISNDDNFTLLRDSDQEIGGYGNTTLYFKIADTTSDQLRYYPFIEKSIINEPVISGPVPSPSILVLPVANFNSPSSGSSGGSSSGGNSSEGSSSDGGAGIVINAIGTNYKFSGWSNEQYPVIDLFGEKYVTLFNYYNTLNYRVDKLAKLVLDSDTNYTLKAGEKLDLGKGYTLGIKDFDNEGKKVWLEFSKDGQFIDDHIIDVYGNSAEKTWTVALDNVQGENSIAVMKVHANQITSNASGNILQIDGIWLIDFANTKTLKIDEKLGAFKLTGINGDKLVFELVDDQLALNETQITNNLWTDGSTIYGDRIVWGDYRNGKADIYMYNLSTSKETQITTSGKAYSPKIYGNRIVWRDCRQGYSYSDIYMYDLSTYKETQITTSGKAGSPVIYGNRIAWSDSRNGYGDIYMYNLSTSKETQITTNESAQTEPAIYGDRIVWTDWRNDDSGNWSNSDIYMYNLSTSKEAQITTNESKQYSPAIYGDRIVWTDEKNENLDICMYNLSTSKETRITTSGFADYSKIYEDRIVWQDLRNENSDIYMYDLSTSKEIQITTNKLDQTDPDIYGDRLVWNDKRNGYGDIYMFTVSGEETEPKLPLANFNSNVTQGSTPLSIQFTDLSQNATGRNWDFENDEIVDSTDKNPVRTYTVPGKYTVKLIAFNANGTNSKLTTINILEQTNTVLPVANFYSPQADPANVDGVSLSVPPVTVSFIDSSTGSPTSWFWDFGDGNTSTDENPTHTYAEDGGYTVTLTVRNDAGSDTVSKYGYVITGMGIAVFPGHFSSDVVSGNSPLTVVFYDPSTDVINRYWSFGDGTSFFEDVKGNESIASPYVTHTYTKAGKYTVLLKVSGYGSDSIITKYHYINVTESKAPVASFTANVTSGKAPLTIKFMDATTGKPISWKWSFGDGINSTEQNPEHTYSTVGNYKIMLTATNSTGSNTTTKFDYIKVTEATQKPVVNFISNVTQGSTPLSVQFTDLSKNATEWNWNFGDGATSTVKNPTHTYSVSGTYTINLTVSNTNGTSSKLSTIAVFNPADTVLPEANFSTNITQGFAPLSVKFTDLSKNATLRNWNFGDGVTSNEQNPTHTYSASGIYTINLTVSNGKGTTSKSAAITVLQVTSSSNESIGSNNRISSGGSSHSNGSRLSIVNNGESNNTVSNSTGKMNTTTIVIRPQPENNTFGLEQSNHNTGANVKHTPEQTQSPNSSVKGRTKASGFEAVCGIISLLAVFLHNRK